MSWLGKGVGESAIGFSFLDLLRTEHPVFLLSHPPVLEYLEAAVILIKKKIRAPVFPLSLVNSRLCFGCQSAGFWRSGYPQPRLARRSQAPGPSLPPGTRSKGTGSDWALLCRFEEGGGCEGQRTKHCGFLGSFLSAHPPVCGTVNPAFGTIQKPPLQGSVRVCVPTHSEARVCSQGLTSVEVVAEEHLLRISTSLP